MLLDTTAYTGEQVNREMGDSRREGGEKEEHGGQTAGELFTVVMRTKCASVNR